MAVSITSLTEESRFNTKLLFTVSILSAKSGVWNKRPLHVSAKWPGSKDNPILANDVLQDFANERFKSTWPCTFPPKQLNRLSSFWTDPLHV